MTKLCNLCFPVSNCTMMEQRESCKRHQLLAILDRIPEFDMESTRYLLIFHLARKIETYALDKKVKLSQKELNVVNEIIKTWEGF